MLSLTQPTPTIVVSQASLSSSPLLDSFPSQPNAVDDPPIHLETAPVFKWTKTLRDELKLDLCQFFVAGNISWSFIENPYARHFFQKWIPGLYMPDSKAMSGRILDEHVMRIEKEMMDEVVGKHGTGQCDGLKGISRESVISSMVNVESQVCSLTA